MQTKHLRVLIHTWTKGEVGALKRFKPSSQIFLLTVPRRYFFCGSFVLFMTCVCHAFAFVQCCLVVTWRERADLLDLVCDAYCAYVTFLFGIVGQMWYLIVLIPDHCCLSYLHFWFWVPPFSRKYVTSCGALRKVAIINALLCSWSLMLGLAPETKWRENFLC